MAFGNCKSTRKYGRSLDSYLQCLHTHFERIACIAIFNRIFDVTKEKSRGHKHNRFIGYIWHRKHIKLTLRRFWGGQYLDSVSIPHGQPSPPIRFKDNLGKRNFYSSTHTIIFLSLLSDPRFCVHRLETNDLALQRLWVTNTHLHSHTHTHTHSLQIPSGSFFPEYINN